MEYSTLGQRFILGLEVTVIGMLIVFAVLALLCWIISLLSGFLQRFEKPKKAAEDELPSLEIDETQEYKSVEKTGFTSGEANVIDADDEEIAAILAAVAFECDIPLSELKIKSIKPVKE
ncbi:sodium pump decarboxylase gamma subunit [Caldicellulosiruptor kronotskyensis 2002]|uniref:Sodium pump decarboxylase gamma subunit n=1 Tax=Caldicellulosiruptor kronotskyensis (strain DSM 18902 / VKM B-2412 / 2002) TaxID=632348 RepID=E4SDU6_CALK2|nr:OadG family protein [Caldicellulosiruptor kronotskyensis]ADQ45233.1 sodium pump decarboxylase gamma subunit [Caldicellulosiruptor kronotskyensis 2002]